MMWDESSGTVFERLKETVFQEPVLSMHNFQLTFMAKTGAFDNGVGAVLGQKRKPLAFFCTDMGEWFCGKSAYECELVGRVFAMKKWHQYLVGGKFLTVTEYASSRHCMNQESLSPEFLNYWGVILRLGNKSKKNSVANGQRFVPEGKNEDREGHLQALINR